MILKVGAWANFAALCWCLMLGVVTLNVLSGGCCIVFLLLALATSDSVSGATKPRVIGGSQ